MSTRLEKLEALAREISQHGLRHDLNPTLKWRGPFDPDPESTARTFMAYLVSLRATEKVLRKMAREALEPDSVLRVIRDTVTGWVKPLDEDGCPMKGILLNYLPEGAVIVAEVNLATLTSEEIRRTYGNDGRVSGEVRQQAPRCCCGNACAGGCEGADNGTCPI